MSRTKHKRPSNPGPGRWTLNVKPDLRRAIERAARIEGFESPSQWALVTLRQIARDVARRGRMRK